MHLNLSSMIETAQFIVKNYCISGETVVDGTVGNGGDTLFLSKLVGNSGVVYGFDIQKTAIDTTEALLIKNGINNVTLLCTSHEFIGNVINKKIGGAMFNLGYLPGADRSIVTKPESTLSALRQTFDLLKTGGVVTVVSYRGHQGGDDEFNVVAEFFRSIDEKQIKVTRIDHWNSVKKAPVLFAGVKIGDL